MFQNEEVETDDFFKCRFKCEKWEIKTRKECAAEAERKAKNERRNNWKVSRSVG